MAKSKRVGHPLGHTPSVDQLINEYLQKNNGSATWKKLKEVRKPSISDSALKAAIDRMVVNKRLTIKAEKVEGKTTTLYCLPDTIYTKGDKNFLQWADQLMVDIEAAHKKDIELGVTRLHYGPGERAEEYLSCANTQSEQADALYILINILGSTILDELVSYSQKKSDAEAEQYIDAVIKTNFSVLIKSLAKIVSPKYGDAKGPIESVVEKLEELDPSKLS